MITGFIMGLLSGMFLAWLGQRKLIKQLKLSNESLHEASAQNAALAARLKAANAALAMLVHSQHDDAAEDIAA